MIEYDRPGGSSAGPRCRAAATLILEISRAAVTVLTDRSIPSVNSLRDAIILRSGQHVSNVSKRGFTIEEGDLG